MATADASEACDAAKRVRECCRSGEFTGCTAGMAPGYEQANLTVLPKRLAYPFLVYCIRNPQACPLLDVTDPGNPCSPLLGEGSDVRTDLPKYFVHKNGRREEKTDIKAEWNADSVAFLSGCSFGFEAALQKEGISVRHLEEGVTTPMYVTSVQTARAEPFGGPLVVSMRPVAVELVDKVVSITQKFPRSHGGPVHWGDPSLLGIADLSRPDFGDAVTVRENEVPVFWACGVTTQLAVRSASPELWMSHFPGCMFVTDLPSNAASRLRPIHNRLD